MKTITSRSNPLYKQWLSEHKRAARPGHLAWLEGVHLCQSWLARYSQPVWAIINQDAAHQPDIEALIGDLDAERQVWMPETMVLGMSSLVSAPPIIFLVEVPRQAPVVDFERNCVVLDDVQDPGNVGAILRTAAAAGISEVFTSLATAACWSPKVLRAGQGAHFALKIHEGQDLQSLLRANRSNPDRLPVLVTTLSQSAQPLYNLSLPKQAIWVFGHEGRGVAPDIIALADCEIYIAHDTAAVESLNVASAAAICLFEQRRQMSPKRCDQDTINKPGADRA